MCVEHLKREFSVENLLFYRRASDFAEACATGKLDDASERNSQAAMIYASYITHGGDLQVSNAARRRYAIYISLLELLCCLWKTFNISYSWKTPKVLRVTFFWGWSDLSVTTRNIFNNGKGRNSRVTLKKWYTKSMLFQCMKDCKWVWFVLQNASKIVKIFPLAPLALAEQMYTYFERWRDEKQAFVSPCDWRNLKFGLFASVFS